MINYDYKFRLSQSINLKLIMDKCLNRINAMEQIFEAKLQQILERNSNFEKCVLEQLSQLKQQNNLSIWMTIQEIDHNTKDLIKQIKQLKQQQIAQFESITNMFQRISNNNYNDNNDDTDSYDEYNKYRGSRLSIIKSKIQCDCLSDWNKMNNNDKTSFCSILLTRLFPKELYQETIEPKNSFYLKFATKLIEEWKNENKWNEENWEMTDNKKQLISKMWSFMLLNWEIIVSETKVY